MLNYTTYLHPTSKDWVTFVHGAGGSSTIWFKQIRAFKKEFNVLMLDLRGHGNSKPSLKDAFNTKYTFYNVTNDIYEVLTHLGVKTSHFVGISLGTILIRNLAENHPKMVKSMVLGGAIMKLNVRSRILVKLGVIFKSLIPYMILYKFFAFIIMPRKNHKTSRILFVNEAKKMYQKEFVRWFKLTSEINPLLRFFRAKAINIPTFYVMGQEDHLFLPTIKNIVKAHKTATLTVFENCGHVVNVEQPNRFNDETINFLKSV